MRTEKNTRRISMPNPKKGKSSYLWTAHKMIKTIIIQYDATNAEIIRDKYQIAY
jgi:hypothetical protein